MASKTTRRPLRSIVMATATIAAAAVVATIASAGPGSAPNLAKADPGDTFVPIGSSQLLQSEDLSAIQVTLDTAKVVLNRDDDFSSCLGEGNPWTAVLKGSKKPFTVSWTSRRQANKGLTESIAQAATPAEAKRYAKTLVEEAIGLCQGSKSSWDFHYGRTTSSPVGSGSGHLGVVLHRRLPARGRRRDRLLQGHQLRHHARHRHLGPRRPVDGVPRKGRRQPPRLSLR